MNRILRHRKKLLLVCAAALLFCALYSGLVVRRYTLSSARIVSPVKLVVISDLHSQYFGEDQQKLIKKVTKESPDLILLTGDIIDDTRPVAGAEAFLRGVAGTCPIYYVTGNHDYWYDDMDAIRALIADCGGTVLSDRYEIITVGENRIAVAGVDDPVRKYFGDISYRQKQSMQAAFSDLPQEDAFRLLLAHRPERIATYLSYEFDLVVNGHAHGGQIRIPFLINGVYAVDQGWLPDLAGGLYRHGATTQIVSRGLANKTRLPRVFNPPEIVVITLLPQKEA